jgi:hypothetical protein
VISLCAQDLLTQGLKQDRMNEWIGGGFCAALVDRMHQWVKDFSKTLPQKYSELVFAETCRLTVVSYVRNMIYSYVNNKKLKLSKKGIEQLSSDLKFIQNWIAENISLNFVTYENSLLVSLIQFLNYPNESLLTSFSDAIQLFGLQHAFHIYDLMRLMLKYRIDMTPNIRRSVLGLCGEFLQQLQVAVSSDTKLLNGITGFEVKVLCILCPNVGLEHCTG